MEKAQERPPAKNPRIDGLLTIPTIADSTHVVNVINQDSKNDTIDRIQPMVSERYSRSQSPPGDMSSTLTSTFSSNSSVHTPH